MRVKMEDMGTLREIYIYRVKMEDMGTLRETQ